MRFLKRNYLIIVSFLILLVIVIFSANEFVEQRNLIKQKNVENINFCLNTEYKNTEFENYCTEILNNKNIEIDFFTTYTNIVLLGLGKYTFILFLFVIIPSLYNTSKYLKNKIILEDASRMDYKKIKRKIIFESYKSVFILPLIIIISFLICYAISGNFDSTYAIKNSTTVWSKVTLSHSILFMLSYLINFIFHCILYINISLIIFRKYHNYFVSVILSFLLYIGIEAILEIGLNGILFTSILKSGAGIIFNIMNYITFNDGVGVLPILLISSTFAIGSSVVVYFKYKDKEKLIIDCEAND